MQHYELHDGHFGTFASTRGAQYSLHDLHSLSALMLAFSVYDAVRIKSTVECLSLCQCTVTAVVLEITTGR